MAMWKRFLFLTLLVQAIGGSTAFADRTVYTVVMCDTNARGKDGLREAVANCGKTFLSMVEAFGRQGVACAQPEYIPGDQVGVAEVRRRVSALPIGNTDTLLFFYVGHGKSRERVHILATSRGEIPRDEMRNALMTAPRVRPRLTLMLTECCANEQAPKPLGVIPMYGLSLDEKVPDRNLLVNLLLDHSGFVDITSCSYDETSAAGLFSDELKFHMEAEANFDSYDVNRDGFVSWREFFPVVVRSTNEDRQELQKRIGGGDHKTQIPYAFSLGTAPRDVETEIYAANFGFHFTMTSRDFWNAARLTQNPDPDTSAGRIGLRAGDVLDTLDDLPIWNPIDVFGHHLDTKVRFYRGGQMETRVADLPLETPFPPGVPKELFAQNFVMSYHLIPFGKQFGARITRLLTNNSPLKAVRMVPGDRIVLIDGELIHSPRDVENHGRETVIIYIDVRTGLVKRAVVNLL
jgi:hypothetical protein